MVEFDIRRKTDDITRIYRLYAIYGNDKNGRTKILIVGRSYSAAMTDIPVIDITDEGHISHWYDENNSAAEVCKDFGIDSSTARYLDDYNSFKLIFQHDEEED